ncbi:MAG: CheY-P-specific phosphatase CheC [Clostridiales bacterium]|jgi:chemotaxis protein CheC|nr:CheY-P-specific phosphatase CheC [Clostridiales bacterium]
MSKVNLDDVDSLHMDVLREIGNIGAGNATTALSQMINARIDMGVPQVNLLEFKDLAEIIGGAETPVVGILFSLEGDVSGMMMFMLELKDAHVLVNLLCGGDSGVGDEFTEMDLSALQEIGNIIAGAYLSSLSTLTNLLIISSVPYMSMDMAGAILSVPAIEFGKVGDKALLIESCFGEEDSISGYFILIPELASYDKILNSLGI